MEQLARAKHWAAPLLFGPMWFLLVSSFFSVSLGPRWRQQFTCPSTYIWKHSSFASTRAHQVSCDFHFVEAPGLSFVFYSLVLRQLLCLIRQRGAIS
ncbi:hypothetical protein PoB_001803800 [Plakobranchus ocellatus]|uniref:Secreted protein n=1 Tax=Plakobranchus ocellatus TaxID=259542 RepID=A0AAV3Z9U3_9GAST|nr:hypothetical protein PoB_001803800 [Plakobranchus ocellatus]